MKKSLASVAFDVCNYTFLILLALTTLYPMLHIFFSSISEPAFVVQNRGLILYPRGTNFEAYVRVFENPMITLAYWNTLIYVVAGTAINILLTACGAYALSRRNVLWMKPVMFLIVFSMFFSGGLIPLYLLVGDLGMMNSRLAVIIPTAVNAFNLIIMRTSFQAVPVSLEESAKLDGANDMVILFRIILPLSLPVVAVITLFYAVGHWNSWFPAMIFLQTRELLPLQLILREILISNTTGQMMTDLGQLDQIPVAETIQYATVMVATLPILFLYPFLQKYFVKGVMIGAIKE